MPIFLDRHDVGEASVEDIAELHVKDLEIEGKHGVKFLTYWYDAARRTTFCLVDAPHRELADKVHAEAHGHVANEMIAVDLSAVEAFLGRIQDPPSAKSSPLDDSASPGSIVVSGDVRDACAGTDLAFDWIGSETLKGFSERVQLYAPTER